MDKRDCKNPKELNKGDSYDFLKKAWESDPEELEAYAADPEGKKLARMKVVGYAVGFGAGCMISLVICLVTFKGAGVAVFLRTVPFIAGAYICTELVQRIARKGTR